jgi:hypothetical protein
MALQQPSYDQVVSRAPRSPAWFGQLMAFSVTLLALATVVYLGIIFGFRPYLESRVVSLDQEIEDFTRQVPEDEQKAIATFYSQLSNIRTVLAKHTATPEFLSWLESGTVQNVQLTKVTYNTSSRQAQISGVARSTTDVASQVVALQNLPGVERVDFRSSSQAGANVIFDLLVTVAPGSFTASQGAAPTQ